MSDLQCLKVGDEVVTIQATDGWFSKGCKGTIVTVNEESNLYKVKFVTGVFESGGDDCWWCTQDEIEVVPFVGGISDFVTADVSVEPLTDFGYTIKNRVSGLEETPEKDYERYLQLYQKLPLKQYKKLEKVALKLDKIGETIGADYHEMLELLKRHF